MVTGVSHSLFYKLCLLAGLNRRSEKLLCRDQKKSCAPDPCLPPACYKKKLQMVVCDLERM